MRNCRTDTVALKKIMVENGIDTILELSERTGVHRNTLGKVLDGTIQPSSEVMDKLVSGLEIEPERAGKIFFAISLRNA